MKEKMKRERLNEMKGKLIFSKKCCKTLIGPKCFEKKSLSDELFFQFFFESSESDRVFNHSHDSGPWELNQKGFLRAR